MKRTIMMLGAIMGVAMALSGCASLKTALNAHVVNPLNDQQVSAVGNALGLAQAVAVSYAALPLCPAGTSLSVHSACHDKNLLRTISASMHAADTAYSDLVAFQQANPQGSTIVGGSFSKLLAQAQAALGALTGIEKAYQIGGAA